MKARFISRLVSTPWNISPFAGRTIIASMVTALLKSDRPGTDVFGDPLPKLSVVGDMALIPISGYLMLNCPDWIKQYGFNITDPNDIQDELDQVLNDPNVTFIVLLVDSPGGESVAGEKLYDLVENAMRKKPVFGWSGDGAQMCSSAYQACAPALAIFGGKYAEIGCIGTYMAYLDDSAYWETMGLKWETFRSGDLKGIDGALTADQRSYFEATTAQYGARFRSGVAKYRTQIDPADMQGQTFRGIEAAQGGFLAATAKDQDAAIAKMRKLL